MFPNINHNVLLACLILIMLQFGSLDARPVSKEIDRKFGGRNLVKKGIWPPAKFAFSNGDETAVLGSNVESFSSTSDDADNDKACTNCRRSLSGEDDGNYEMVNVAMKKRKLIWAIVRRILSFDTISLIAENRRGEIFLDVGTSEFRFFKRGPWWPWPEFHWHSMFPGSARSTNNLFEAGLDNPNLLTIRGSSNLDFDDNQKSSSFFKRSLGARDLSFSENAHNPIIGREVSSSSASETSKLLETRSPVFVVGPGGMKPNFFSMFSPCTGRHCRRSLKDKALGLFHRREGKEQDLSATVKKRSPITVGPNYKVAQFAGTCKRPHCRRSLIERSLTKLKETFTRNTKRSSNEKEKIEMIYNKRWPAELASKEAFNEQNEIEERGVNQEKPIQRYASPRALSERSPIFKSESAFEGSEVSNVSPHGKVEETKKPHTK